MAAWLLPAALLVTAGVQVSFLGASADWGGRLTPPVLGVSILAALVLGAGRLRLAVLVSPGRVLRVTGPAAVAAAALGLLSLVAAPATWAAISVADGNGSAWLPQAGPASGFGGGGGPGFGGVGFGGRASRNFTFPGSRGGAQGGGPGLTSIPPASAGGAGGFGAGGPNGGGGQPGRGFGGRGGFGGGGAITFAGTHLPALDPTLLRYLGAHRGTARFLVATTTSSYASLFILATGQPAMALGGYQGWDRIVTPKGLARLVATGTVRFFYISPASAQGVSGGIPGQQQGSQGRATGASGTRTSGQGVNLNGTNTDLTSWVQGSCVAVPAKVWQGVSGGTTATSGGVGGGGGLQLYDCSRASTAGDG